MDISLGSWAFLSGPYSRSPISFERVAKRLSEAGYDGIEPCGFRPHVTLDRYPTGGSRRELVAFLEDLELGVSGYEADLTEVNPFVQGNKRKYLDLFQRNLELCADIGSPGIRVDTIAAADSISKEESALALGRVAEIWGRAAEMALEAKVKVLWEFQPRPAFHQLSQIVALHNAVGHKNFKIQFNTAHAYMCGAAGARQPGSKETSSGLLEFLSKLEGRIGHIHLSGLDDAAHTNAIGVHHPFEESRIDFRTLAPKLLAVPGIGWWCIDLRLWPRAWELVERSREFVASLLRAGARRHAVSG